MHISVFVVMMLLGVSSTRTLAHSSTIAQSERERVCAELCRAGLGGAPCGPVCYDLMPRQLLVPQETATTSKPPPPPPSPSPSSSSFHPANQTTDKTRSNVCPVLCRNRLGEPLCKCHARTFNDDDDEEEKNDVEYDLDSVTVPSRKVHRHVNYQDICNYYCEQENLVLRGCPMCQNPDARCNGEVLPKKQPSHPNYLNNAEKSNNAQRPLGQSMLSTMSWPDWCTKQCANADGGTACNCDLMPFLSKP